jgi:hypothetical protein
MTEGATTTGNVPCWRPLLLFWFKLKLQWTRISVSPSSHISPISLDDGEHSTSMPPPRHASLPPTAPRCRPVPRPNLVWTARPGRWNANMSWWLFKWAYNVYMVKGVYMAKEVLFYMNMGCWCFFGMLINFHYDKFLALVFLFLAKVMPNFSVIFLLLIILYFN